MSKSVTPNQLSKKETQKIIFEKLSATTIDYKSKLKDKKFINSLKKVSKQFAADIIKSSKEDKATKKKKKIKKQKTEETTPIS